MTRLTSSDICDISFHLKHYNNRLLGSTGRSLLGIASHAWEVDEKKIIHRIKPFRVHVVPVTAGQGVITAFSDTVAAVLRFMGFDARVTDQSDTSGLASAFEDKADAVMMADDNRFVGINLHTRRVIDNTKATGKVFAAALDLMTGGVKNRDVLIMGCGPVGSRAAQKVLQLGAHIVLYDTHLDAAISLKAMLSSKWKDRQIRVEEDLLSALLKIPNVIEATPSIDTIPDKLISSHMRVTAPGVPLGLSKYGRKILNKRLVHDKLELGVAAMAVNLVLNENQGG